MKNWVKKNFYTTYQAREYLMVSHSTIIDWIESGQLKAIKTLGGHRRIPKSELERFIRMNNMHLNRRANNRILIVDDDEAICVGLKEMLEKHGFAVKTASDGFEAGVMAISFDPGLMILDLKMPGLDGFSTCKLIRDNPLLKDIRILILTGYPSKDNFEKALRLGADRCLAKPVQKQKLLREARRLLKAR